MKHKIDRKVDLMESIDCAQYGMKEANVKGFEDIVCD